MRRGRARWARRGLLAGAGLVLLWLLAAYGVAPALWRRGERGADPGSRPVRAVTGDGIPGDPLNVGFVGSRAQVARAMLRAGWRPADEVTLRSSVAIAASVALDRPVPEAPVSPLFVFGRRQDLAFERPVGGSARERHHVRLWAVPPGDSVTGRVWTGAATFDRGVGLSRYTEQVTHHISPDVDAERDTLIANLAAAGTLAEVRFASGVGPTVSGRNGGGDWFYTDGEMLIGTLRDSVTTLPPRRRVPPPHVRLKNATWRPLRALLP